MNSIDKIKKSLLQYHQFELISNRNKYMNDNEMIAQFMGMQKNKHNEWKGAWFLPEYVLCNEGHKNQFAVQDLAFDRSWDWLMPVVCKIDDLFGDDDYIDDQINKVHNAVLKLDRELIHNSVARFIIDYEIKMWQLDNGFPFMEGDDYWVIEDDGSLSTLSCWDDMSEEMHLENPNRKYFSSEEEGIDYINNKNI